MPRLDPLPFRLRVPNYDAIDLGGIVSISIRIEGILNLVGDILSLEWTAIRKVESVSWSGIRDEVDYSPIGSCDIPLSLILETRLAGRWWAPRLELRARSLEVFEEIPTAQNGVVRLLLGRRDRVKAQAICAAIDATLRLSGTDTPDMFPPPP